MNDDRPVSERGRRAGAEEPRDSRVRARRPAPPRARSRAAAGGSRREEPGGEREHDVGEARGRAACPGRPERRDQHEAAGEHAERRRRGCSGSRASRCRGPAASGAAAAPPSSSAGTWCPAGSTAGRISSAASAHCAAQNALACSQVAGSSVVVAPVGRGHEDRVEQRAPSSADRALDQRIGPQRVARCAGASARTSHAPSARPPMKTTSTSVCA